jgi:anti-sigma factor ChrR (cupin superfamily)
VSVLSYFRFPFPSTKGFLCLSHAGIEELHLLHGIRKVDDRTLYPGDFIHSEAGSVDHRVWSEIGCTCFLVTSTEDALS